MSPSQTKEKQAEYSRRYRAKHRDAYNERMRERYHARRTGHRERRYGITEAEIAVMLVAQCGCCAVCGSGEPSGRGTWHVDHNHETGLVRGMLCHHCNLGLGNFKDDPDRLQAAIDYLRRH